MNRQRRWEGGENEMKHRKTTVSWQNDTGELCRKEQVFISQFRMGYTGATHRRIIKKTDIPDFPFCDVQLKMDHILWQCSRVSLQSTVWNKGTEGSKKLVQYIRKIGFFHGI
jgi:hypothetical protein